MAPRQIARKQASAQELRASHPPRNSKGKYASQSKSTDCTPVPPLPSALNAAIDVLAHLPDDTTTTYDDKVARVRALPAWWEYEDNEEEALDGDALQTRQRTRCKELGLIVFGFKLHEAQIEAIYILFYERRDLLLLAKTGFGKSLIFQLIPFLTSAPGVVLTLMPLKLLQAEQSKKINGLLGGKGIILNGENNTNSVLAEIANGGYSHVFTSPEIALSKKFKKGILDHSSFTDRLYLLAVDEIHLVEEWGKNFRPMYAEIEKVRKRIPCHVPLLGVSATLTKSVQARVVEKAGFLPNYRLLQTSLDRPEIMQIHRFMEHPKSSCLDLQFILPAEAKEAKDIQKTLIFVNSVNEIRVIIDIIHAWMKKLDYPAGSTQWIRPYHSAMSEWDKTLTAKAFGKPGTENTECTILVATNAYGMGIDNPDVKLVIQWDIPLSFDSMIQRMGRAGRKGGASSFILLTPRWTRIKDPEEIEKRVNSTPSSISVNAQLSDSNRPKALPKTSPLSQVLNAEDDLSDAESIAGSEADFEYDEEANLFSGILASDADQDRRERKKELQTSQTDATKRSRLPNEIFDYIHVVRCRRLFSLAWYDDMTYAQSEDSSPTKALPIPCCNSPSCNSTKPYYTQREPFVNTVIAKATEADREWMACRTLALKQWRTETSIRLWNAAGVKKAMPKSLVMPDCCLITLAKSGGLLNLTELIKFLEPWYGVSKHAEEILHCLEKNRPSLNSNVNPNVDSATHLPSKAERKATLQALRASKKLKNMDDLLIAEDARMVALRDQWLINRGKATPEIKARIKKAAAAEKKQAEKEDKVREKARNKNQSLGIRRLALNNSQAVEFGTFKNVLSDPATAPPDDPSEAFSPKVLTAAKLRNTEKKKEQQRNKLTGRFNVQKESVKIPRASPPPPVAMELIRPGKRKVRVPANAVESTPPKRMRQATD